MHDTCICEPRTLALSGCLTVRMDEGTLRHSRYERCDTRTFFLPQRENVFHRRVQKKFSCETELSCCIACKIPQERQDDSCIFSTLWALSLKNPEGETSQMEMDIIISDKQIGRRCDRNVGDTALQPLSKILSVITEVKTNFKQTPGVLIFVKSEICKPASSPSEATFKHIWLLAAVRNSWWQM